jgi:hypothetical protein
MISFRKFGRLGRFGNQLFQYAAVRLYAEKHNFRFALPQWMGCDIFQDIRPQTSLERILSHLLPTRHLADIKSYNRIEKLKYMAGISRHLPETVTIEDLYRNPEDNINFYSYFQDPFSLQRLAEHKDKVKQWYRFNSELENSLQSATQSYQPWIGVHIRRGDLIKRNLSVPLEKYRQALAQYAQGYKIYIASDDPDIHKEFKDFEFINPPRPQHIRGDVFDFWMLAHAQKVIGGGSTFSWWTAYLGSGEYYSPPLTHLWNNTLPEFQKWEL